MNQENLQPDQQRDITPYHYMQHTVHPASYPGQPGHPGHLAYHAQYNPYHHHHHHYHYHYPSMHPQPTHHRE
jgi:hypothetical protein